MKDQRAKKREVTRGRPSDLLLDNSVLECLKSRDRQFLERLFADVNPYLARVCAANGINGIDAEEVIYDTWDRFFVNLGAFEGRSQIRTFICGILFNKIREYRRSLGRISYEEDSEKFMGHAFTQEGWWNVNPHSPDKILELKRSGFMLQECIEGLTEQQKTAFLLREVEEENSDEICNILGVNVSHLRVLIFRAKDKLRKCLEGKTGLEEA